MGKKHKKRIAVENTVGTPVYDSLVEKFGFAPHDLPTAGWRNIPDGSGLLEDNFS